MIRGLMAVVLGILWVFPTQGAIVLELDAFPATTSVSLNDTLTITLRVNGMQSGDVIHKLSGQLTFTEGLFESNGAFLWNDDLSVNDIGQPGLTPGTLDVTYDALVTGTNYTREEGNILLYFDVKVIGSGPGQISFQPFSFEGRDNEDNPLGQPTSPPPIQFNPNVPEPTSLLTWSLVGLSTIGTWGWRRLTH